MKRDKIIDLFVNPIQTMFEGIWFSGEKYKGEYKSWHKNGLIWEHSFYKDGVRDGEYKEWYKNGQLYLHDFYKDGMKIK